MGVVRRFVPVLLAILVAAGCSQTPTGPSASAPVKSIGALSQGGDAPPPIAGDAFCAVNGSVCPVLGATKFLAFGDSLTHGSPSSYDVFDLLFNEPPPAGNYPSQLLDILKQQFPSQAPAFRVVNGGWPGEQVIPSSTRSRFQQLMAQERPQAVLLLEGINDLNSGASVSRTVSALGDLIDVARTYNATVFIATMFQTCPSFDPIRNVQRENSSTQITAFNSAVTSMASGRPNVSVVNLYSVFGNNCTATGGTGPLGRDGLHPNSIGYGVIASKFRENVIATFAVRGGLQ